MSQVSNQPVNIPLVRLVSESAHVVVVRSLGKQVVVFEATLPQETSYEKAGETQYQETADLFRVLKVLKSDTLRIGEEIKVWKEPAYDFDSVKRYHTTGVSESPVILTYQPIHPAQGDEWIILLSGPSKYEGVWVRYLDAAEGLAAEKDILAALKTEPPARGVLPQ
jgi:hypothetical protein